MICKFFDVLFGFRCCEIRSSDLFPYMVYDMRIDFYLNPIKKLSLRFSFNLKNLFYNIYQKTLKFLFQPDKRNPASACPPFRSSWVRKRRRRLFRIRSFEAFPEEDSLEENDPNGWRQSGSQTHPLFSPIWRNRKKFMFNLWFAKIHEIGKHL